MKIETAIKQIQNEADFQGMGLLETLQDIQKHLVSQLIAPPQQWLQSQSTPFGRSVARLHLSQ